MILIFTKITIDDIILMVYYFTKVQNPIAARETFYVFMTTSQKNKVEYKYVIIDSFQLQLIAHILQHQIVA